MQQTRFLKAWLLALVIVCVTIICWELHLRKTGRNITYDDGPSLWSDKRKDVYEPIDKSTVFIGSSRIKFDLDIKTWQQATGDHAIQLANVGSSPRPILTDLANDKNFKGKLIIDVTEGLFFSTIPPTDATPLADLAYYKKETPSQKFSFIVNHALESRLVFLDKDFLSLNTLILDRVKIPNRPGVFQFPDFPYQFEQVTFDRQNYMTDQFVHDTTLRNKVIGIWEFFRTLGPPPPTSPQQIDSIEKATLKEVDSILVLVKRDCDKITARGGNILFLRTPGSGPMRFGEDMAFPRNKYWDKLLATTGLPGIHFADYQALSHFECPELSHLSLRDAVIYTKAIIDIMKEKGWKFPQAGTNIPKVPAL